MQVLVYNGWCHNGPPVIGYLERSSPTTGKLSSSLPGSTFSQRGNLVLKVCTFYHILLSVIELEALINLLMYVCIQGSLEVSDLMVDPNTEVVFQLEYVVSWNRATILHSTARDTPSRRSASKTSDKVSTFLAFFGCVCVCVWF